jgi:hypothetical protein
MPTIDLTDTEHAAVTAAIKRVIEGDRFPLATRLDPLRSALAKLDPAAAAAFRGGGQPENGRPRPVRLADHASVDFALASEPDGPYTCRS